MKNSNSSHYDFISNCVVNNVFMNVLFRGRVYFKNDLIVRLHNNQLNLINLISLINEIAKKFILKSNLSYNLKIQTRIKRMRL
jgi:hypothetical protein